VTIVGFDGGNQLSRGASKVSTVFDFIFSSLRHLVPYPGRLSALDTIVLILSLNGDSLPKLQRSASAGRFFCLWPRQFLIPDIHALHLLSSALLFIGQTQPLRRQTKQVSSKISPAIFDGLGDRLGRLVEGSHTAHCSDSVLMAEPGASVESFEWLSYP